MNRLSSLLRNLEGVAATELALVMPLLLAVMFGSVEVGNLFLDQHALTKQVRDGARYASRLTVSSTYSCTTNPSTVFQDPNATSNIIHVTEDGVVSGSGSPRWTGYWSSNCDGATSTVTVSIRCVRKSDIDTAGNGVTGIYSGLPGNDIPVVKVAGAVKYRSVLSTLGFNATDICLRAQTEAAVQGI